MKIIPCKVKPASRSSGLIGIRKAEIIKRLKFEPNGKPDVDFDADKTVNCWMFSIAGEKCQIRDYGDADDYKGKRGDANKYWSFQGNPDVLEYLFPGHVEYAIYTAYEHVYRVVDGAEKIFVATKFEANYLKSLRSGYKIIKVSIKDLCKSANTFYEVGE